MELWDSLIFKKSLSNVFLMLLTRASPHSLQTRGTLWKLVVEMEIVCDNGPRKPGVFSSYLQTGGLK